MEQYVNNIQHSNLGKTMNTSSLSIETIYTNTHNVNILSENGLTNFKVVQIDINKQSQCLEVKLKDQNDPLFNYTTVIDRIKFDRMKNEQYLDICFEEFHLQFVELLQETISNEMLLRLEQGSASCKMVFYEKSKIKSLIFLIVHLSLTDQKDIITEMIAAINQLKELNRNISLQLQTVKKQVKDKEILLNLAHSANNYLEKQFLQSIKLIENTSLQGLSKIEKQICCKIDNLNNRYNNIIKEIDKIKKKNLFRENVYAQTTFQLEQFKRNNEKNYKMIASLKAEIDILSTEKERNEKNAMALRQTIIEKENIIEKLNEEILVLRKDIQEATIIIAQKTKTHDEIAKDLVQANIMLVNFNKQYNDMLKETSNLKDIIKGKDQNLQEQAEQARRLNEEFEKYRRENNPENTNILQHELRKCQKRMEELEKHNREAAKVNGLLTRRLASGDI